MFMSKVILETTRLRLREMTPKDIDFVAAMMAHPEVNFFYDRRFSRTESEVWLERQLERYRRDGKGLWLAELRDSGVPVGQIGLAFQDVEGQRHPEIGWLLDRPHWGQGFATEGGAAIAGAAFTQWGYDHVISLIRPVNIPSQRVARRIGMTEGRRVQFHGYEHCVFELANPARAKQAERARPS
jgi:[ribosomal protein S5]-alanine N-acetyltransferase